MSKFKVGDKVLRICDIAGDLPAGTVCTVISENGFSSIEVAIGGMHKQGWYEDRNFELVEDKESELERLVRVANEFGEIRMKMNEFSDQIEYESYGGWSPITKFTKQDRYRIKPKPKFEPFTVGSGWVVKLEGNTLHVGCKKFDAKEVKDALIEMGRNGRRGYPVGGSTFKFFCTRQGVSQGEYGELLNWTDADKILAALEKAEIK